MRIAINISGAIGNIDTQQDNFTAEIINRVINNHPEHEFILVSDVELTGRNGLPQNCIPVYAGSKGKNPITWKWWYGVSIPSVIKKHKADMLVNCDGCCSLRSRIPQLIIISDLSFISFPQFFKKSRVRFFKKNTATFLQKSISVIAVSGFIKNELVKNYGTADEKISIIYSGANENFKPLDDTGKILAKEKLTGGKEYFLYTGDIHPVKNLTNLLKAFSIFKKTQQSSMKLVIAGNMAAGYTSFAEKLKDYKYRNDVVMKNNVNGDEVAEILGAAYAFINPSFYEGIGTTVLDAMLCHVPVIISSGSAMQELAGDAALFADPESIPDLAAQMMTVYKDEALRSKLIEKGKLIAAKYSWNTSAELLWQSIENAMG
jgi:glycosyltransferase involved in cell wall biosynthesis